MLIPKLDAKIRTSMTKIRTRFAPSPTGELHIGGLRSGLYPYALAKHSNGDFILRIEDTDKKREVAGSKERIGKLLQIFGLSWDEYYLQSERLPLYKKAADKLLASGHAFYCQCLPKNAKNSFVKILSFGIYKSIKIDVCVLIALVLFRSRTFYKFVFS